MTVRGSLYSSMLMDRRNSVGESQESSGMFALSRPYFPVVSGVWVGQDSHFGPFWKFHLPQWRQ